MIKNFDFSSLDLDALEHPNDDFFKVFKAENSPAFFYKLNKIESMLHDKYLYLDDEYRNPQTIHTIMTNYLNGALSGAINLFYEMGDFQGLIGFRKVIPGYKCRLFFKIWDKKLYSRNLVRAVRQIIEFVMNEFNLVRISTESPDKRAIKGGRLAGFELEGEKENGFLWDGKFYKNYLLGKTRIVRDGGEG
jgi:hypothetical protein